MNFKQAMHEYRRLRNQWDSKQISTTDFEAAVNQIHVTDAQGRRWIIGVESGKWYRLEGGNWIEDTPRIRSAKKNSRPAWFWPVTASNSSYSYSARVSDRSLPVQIPGNRNLALARTSDLPHLMPVGTSIKSA